MVRALLAGTKTQTRRALQGLGDQPIVEYDGMYMWKQGYRWGAVTDPKFPPGVRFAVGDRLWVREAWRVSKRWDGTKPRDLPARTMTTFFEAGGSMGGVDPCPRDRIRTPDEYQFDPTYPPVMPDWAGKKQPGMFMMRWMSRLTLTVTDVRVQRLQEISQVDSAAEGCLGKGTYPDPYEVTPRDQYRELWDHLNEARGFGWETNPWVVAVSFTVERRNIDAGRP